VSPDRPVRCVVFDLGGVLVRLAGSWTRACEVVGLPVRGTADTEDARAARRGIVIAHEEGRIDHRMFLEGVVASVGGTYSVAEVDEIHRAWVLEPYPGVEALLHELKRLGVRTGVLSNTNDVHWREQFHGDRGRPPRLNAPIDHPHGSHLLGVRKPARAIYDRFASEVSLEPGDLLFFDDLVENVEGARAAGWRAERIDPMADTAIQIRRHLAAAGILPPASMPS
jgi:FMN phosphatase YigB (HAD superfamily)